MNHFTPFANKNYIQNRNKHCDRVFFPLFFFPILLSRRSSLLYAVNRFFRLLRLQCVQYDEIDSSVMNVVHLCFVFSFSFCSASFAFSTSHFTVFSVSRLFHVGSAVSILMSIVLRIYLYRVKESSIWYPFHERVKLRHRRQKGLKLKCKHQKRRREKEQK